MSSDASFTAHIHQVAATARKYAGWVLRTFNTRERTPLLTLWKSLIIPRLDYCSQLWCPHKASEIQLLENIQRSFTAKVNGISNLNYWERLKFLQLYSLERRRERYLVIYTWKTSEGLVPNNCNLISAETRRHGRKCIVIPPSATVAKTANLIDNGLPQEDPNSLIVSHYHLETCQEFQLLLSRNTLTNFLKQSQMKPVFWAMLSTEQLRLTL